VAENNDSGRVTTREFFNALLAQNDRMGQMELRIVNKINEGITAQQEFQQGVEARLATGSERFKHFDSDIKDLKKWDRGIGILSVIGSIIASAIGIDK